ncbi:MAG: hypothetical protein EXS25_05140 [Pedosphaera sp.]|nr:hypothetical protein [Pedosphaera sp.]
MSKKTLSVFALGSLALGDFSTETLQAQGCVAVRGGGMCTLNHAHLGEEMGMESNQWMASLGYRFFKSDRHFSGDRESRNALGKNRFEQGTEVINYSNFIDLGISYQITPRYSATVTVPLVSNLRSAPYEHSGVRRETRSSGLGDLRTTLGAWVWNPVDRPKGNLQLSLGLKAPTGDFGVTDTFYRDQDPTAGVNIQPVRRPVDQSIQPGDGG